MKHDNTFSSLVVFWESEINGIIEEYKGLLNTYQYMDMTDNKNECIIRLRLILEQIEFFKYPIKEYDFSQIDSLNETHKDFLKENNII
jgi:hypothetical protein